MKKYLRLFFWPCVLFLLIMMFTALPVLAATNYRIIDIGVANTDLAYPRSLKINDKGQVVGRSMEDLAFVCSEQSVIGFLKRP